MVTTPTDLNPIALPTDTTFETSIKTASNTVSLATITNELSLLRKDTSVVASVHATVRNTGDRDGDEVVQIFASAPNAGQDGVPLKTLVAYERLHIKAGASVEQSFAIQGHHFTFANTAGKIVTAPGTWRMWAGVDGEDNAVEVQVV